ALAASVVQSGLRRRGTTGTGPTTPLSQREREVLELVAQGYTNQQIADHLGLSVKTVETYRARLVEKLGLQSRAELVRYALDSGLFGGEPGPAPSRTPRDNPGLGARSPPHRVGLPASQPGSLEHLGIHAAHGPPARQHERDLAAHAPSPLGIHASRRRGDVRCDDDVLHLEQRIGHRRRLLLENVEPG